MQEGLHNLGEPTNTHSSPRHMHNTSLAGSRQAGVQAQLPGGPAQPGGALQHDARRKGAGGARARKGVLPCGPAHAKVYFQMWREPGMSGHTSAIDARTQVRV